MKYILFTLIGVTTVYVASGHGVGAECCVEDELNKVVSEGSSFLDSIQECLDKNPNADLQASLDKVKQQVNQIDRKWIDHCSKEGECSVDEMRAMWYQVLDVKDDLKKMQEKSDCPDIRAVAEQIQATQDRCNL